MLAGAGVEGGSALGGKRGNVLPRWRHWWLSPSCPIRVLGDHQRGQEEVLGGQGFVRLSLGTAADLSYTASRIFFPLPNPDFFLMLIY